MKNSLLIILSSLFILFFVFNFSLADASAPPTLKDAFDSNLNSTAKKAAYKINADDTDALADSINSMINIVLTLLGVIFIGLSVYGGFLYMTARGNEEQTKKGQSVIVQSLIGLIIVLSAYAISFFVFSFFIK
ncbi:MAG: hypothetical protein EOM88_02940 [Clostridia bacterium]|nr:hypothetical protein [Clostridia bacterium]